MFPELAAFLALPLLAFFIAMPAVAAWRRRGVSREASEVAAELAVWAVAVKRESRCLPLEEPLKARLIRLQVGEFASLQLAQELARGDAELLAEAALRLASRLRRRVAFERKMLARTAAGLRRGAVAASLPPVAVLSLWLLGIHIPLPAMTLLFVVEALGCLLLWRLARVEI